VQQLYYGIDEHTLYDKKIYIKHYESYNKRVLYYFRYRPEDFLVLNLSDSDAMQSLCDFLNTNFAYQAMPHPNISKDTEHLYDKK
jgi:hypothetical protein